MMKCNFIAICGFCGMKIPKKSYIKNTYILLMSLGLGTIN